MMWSSSDLRKAQNGKRNSACRVSVAIAFICSSIFLLAGRAESQIQFNPNQDLRNSPAAASCESAISAKVQTDHDALAHFDSNTKVQQDMVGQTRVGGYGDYFSGKEDTRFTFNCVFDEHNKTITLAFYTVYQVGSERLVPPENQAQDCEEKTFSKVYASEGSRVFIIHKSIRSKNKGRLKNNNSHLIVNLS
jgi:hypothetical protein